MESEACSGVLSWSPAMAKNAEGRIAITSAANNQPAFSSKAALIDDDDVGPRAEAIIARIVITNSPPAKIVMRKNGLSGSGTASATGGVGREGTGAFMTGGSDDPAVASTAGPP